jgi:hypothetical protein
MNNIHSGQFPAWMLATLLLIILNSGEVLAQAPDTTKIYRVETTDGNEYLGRIIEQNNGRIRLETEKIGVITLRMSDIVKLEEIKVSQIKDAVYWFENPQATRYLWSPNGFGLKRGEGYYQNIWVLFNQVSVGVTDNFSIGAGMVPLFLFAGSPTPAWITPKFSIPVRKDKVNIGAGALVGGVLGESNTGFGVLYGILTLGNRDKNMSLGLGYGYAGEDSPNSPAISFSAMIRTGQRGYFLTENYYFGGESGVVMFSVGGRRIIKKTGLDFGVLLPSDTGGGLIAVPWLGFSVPFGRKESIE